MCYTAKYLIEKALKRAKHYGVKEDVIRYEDELRDYQNLHAVSGFAHPELIIYTNKEPYRPILSLWGLIPHWVKTETQAHDIWNKTLNARGETLFEKPSFKDSAETKRCLIPAAGFYEYHHYKNKIYPFYITRKDNEPLMLAGIWSLWNNKETGEVINSCSIVTSRANTLMSKIHNNPKLKEARMPLILSTELEEQWLKGANHAQLKQIILPNPLIELEAHTVRKLSGKDSPGNVPEASQYYEYKELSF